MLHKEKRILITAGGTGGHVFPAQALAQQLAKLNPTPEILFAAGGLSTNRYFDRAAFQFQDIACSSLSRNPLKLMKNCGILLKGVWQSLEMIKRFKPHVVVGFGSFYTIPILVAAKVKGIPIVLHEANSIPGKANKWFAPYAAYIGVHFPFTGSHLKGQVVEVGIPLREGFASSCINRSAAMAYYQLSEQAPTILIFGGSQGAHAINHLMAEALPDLKGKGMQFIHITGSADEVEKIRTLYAGHQLKACVKPFENNMQLAWKAADLFIGRSGASTIGEAMEFEVPGLLIPYPHATDGHQEKNADFFVSNVGAGIKMNQEGLSGKKLADAILAMSAQSVLDTKKQAIQSYKRRPRLDLCQLVLKAIK